jgi:hypothetical protein
MIMFDEFWDSKRKDVGKYLWVILLAILKEFAQLGAKELARGLEEYLKEQKTPDGWTQEEYLTYAIGRLTLIREEEIGPFYVDNLIDMGIDRLVDYLRGKLEALDANEPVPPPVVDDDPPPPPPVVEDDDPYYPTVYGVYDSIPLAEFRNGDLLYKKDDVWFVIPVLFAQMPFYNNATQGAELVARIGD